MNTDYRALCAELLWALENAIRIIYREDGTKHISTADPIVARARAALAEPVGEGVTMAELIAFTRSQSPWQAWMEADGCLANAHCEIAKLLHAGLARYGHQPAPPAAGEVE